MIRMAVIKPCRKLSSVPAPVPAGALPDPSDAGGATAATDVLVAAEAAGVLAGVEVSVGVGVGVSVGVGVGVEVSVGVGVGVSVGVGLGVGVSVGSDVGVDVGRDVAGGMGVLVGARVTTATWVGCRGAWGAGGTGVPVTTGVMGRSVGCGVGLGVLVAVGTGVVGRGGGEVLVGGGVLVTVGVLLGVGAMTLTLALVWKPWLLTAITRWVPGGAQAAGTTTPTEKEPLPSGDTGPASQRSLPTPSQYSVTPEPPGHWPPLTVMGRFCSPTNWLGLTERKGDGVAVGRGGGSGVLCSRNEALIG